MRKFYIFTYLAGLKKTMGCAGYHNRFSIAGSLAIFSTKQKANNYMDKLTTEEPNKKHVLMSRANARKHFLGDSVAEFNEIIENNIDIHAQENEEEIEEGEEKKNVIGKFFITELCKHSNEYRGFFIAELPNFYSHYTKKENINLMMGEDLDFNEVAFFKEDDDKKSDSALSEILSPLLDECAKTLYTGGSSVDFYMEYEDGTGDKAYIKVEKA